MSRGSRKKKSYFLNGRVIKRGVHVRQGEDTFWCAGAKQFVLDSLKCIKRINFFIFLFFFLLKKIKLVFAYWRPTSHPPLMLINTILATM